MENNTYILKTSKEDLSKVMKEIERKGGKVEYKSPILPIIGFNANESLVGDLQSDYKIEYIMEADEEGVLLEEGSLTSHFTPLQIMPKVDHVKTRNAGCTGWGVTVAVLDSGTTMDFVKEKYDFTGFGSDPVVNHGDIVVNIIKRFARGSNIVSCKVAQYFNGIQLLQVLSGVDFAVNNIKADIINLSLGFKPKKPCLGNNCAICDIINAYSQQNGVLFVVAAGNDGEEGSIRCPGNAQESITVGSISQSPKAVADYSSKATPGIKKPNILTAGSIYYNGEYSEGTSYSTPIVTGVLAAVKSRKPLSSSQMKDLLYSTADDIDQPFHHQGFGLMNLDRIMEVISDGENNSQIEGQGES